MITRRYREGRLVRARRLRRASLQNARNLVLQRVAGMVEAVDRFSLMLDALASQEHRAAVPDRLVVTAAGCSTYSKAADTDPEGQSNDIDRGEPGIDALCPGRPTTAPSATTNQI